MTKPLLPTRGELDQVQDSFAQVLGWFARYGYTEFAQTMGDQGQRILATFAIRLRKVERADLERLITPEQEWPH